MLLDVIQSLLFLTMVVCFILILVKMFQNGQAILGVVCIVCCGIGPLIAFVFGWMKSSEWNTRQIMIVWTIALIANLGLGVVHQPVFVQQQFQQFQVGAPQAPAN